jgi:pilus assembly protein CpaD
MFDKSYKAANLMRKSGSLAAVLLAGAMLAGCQSVTATHTTLTDQDYRKRHPILIAEQPEVMDIPVAMKASELTPDINRSIHRFVSAYRASGTGFMNIQVPAGSANEVAALTAARAAKNVVQRSGVAPGHIRVSPYQVDNKAWVAPVRLSFLKVKAVAPDCGIWPEDLGKPDTDKQFFNFGCAHQQNLAAMVQNPSDLIAPREMTPADGEQRSRVIDLYRNGGDPSASIQTQPNLNDL